MLTSEPLQRFGHHSLLEQTGLNDSAQPWMKCYALGLLQLKVRIPCAGRGVNC